MDFAGKIRSGRAYLNWTQEKLAQESDLSFQGIQKMERGETKPTERTQNKIIKAFQKNGVVFTDKGIEYEEYPLIFVEGTSHEDSYLQLLQDVIDTLKDKKNAELLIMYADDRVSPPSVNALYRQIRVAGIKMRQLVEDGNTHLIAPLDEYRYIPKEFFINRVTLIYGDRIATETSNFNRALIKVDPINAHIERNTFNMLWSILKQPIKSTADERF